MNLAILVLSLLLVAVGMPQAFAQTEISDKVVVLHTQSGQIVIELFPSDAPETVENFLNLTAQRFYDQTVFHRVIKDFMIQGGDPNTKPGGYQHLDEWGMGNAGYTIAGEFNTIQHKRGIVSMARGIDPNSASSQFFIVHNDSPHLDLDYTAFGRLATASSYDTLDKIANLETGGEETNHIPFDWGKAELLKAEIQNRADIPDLLDLGEPERVDALPEQESQQYSHSRLGFSFDVPAGWFVQEPQKVNPQTPDVVAVGASRGGFTPAISVSVKNAGGGSVSDYAESVKKSLKPALDAGTLVITEETLTNVDNHEAFIRQATGEFEMPTGTINVKFKEITLKSNDKFYILTYTNSDNDFAKTEPKFDDVINSFQITETVTTPPGGGPDDGGCLIATATYGTELAPQVQLLREVRQNVLLNTASGTAFMAGFNQFYYSFSPTVADLERQHPAFRDAVKVAITPMLSTLSILNHVDADSEHQLLGYGIGVILLNVAMYFVAPALAIVKTRDYLARKYAKVP